MNQTHFRQLLEKTKGQTIYVGFSGGADSTALLLLLLEEQNNYNYSLKAVHFQHNLRGEESLQDAAWSRDFCQKYNVDFQEISLDIEGSKLPGEGTEAAARRLRNKHWQQIAGNNAFVALGHHADDRIENLILRLSRGSNSTGLSSMREIQTIGTITYIRPLLNFSKSDIVEYLSEKKIEDWRHDSSNDETIYKRNFIRNELLPQLYAELPYSQKGMSHSLSALQDDADFLESEAQKRFEEISGKKSVPCDFFRRQPPALFIRILRLWLHELLGFEFLPNRRLINRLNSAFGNDSVSGEAKQIPLSNEINLQICRGQISLADTESLEKSAILWNWKEKEMITWGDKTLTAEITSKLPDDLKNAACFDALEIPESLTIRNRKPGDSMIPFGRNSAVKLKKLFSDKKIPASQKNDYPLITSENGILWIPEIRRSDLFTLSDSTISILVIRCS